MASLRSSVPLPPTHSRQLNLPATSTQPIHDQPATPSLRILMPTVRQPDSSPSLPSPSSNVSIPATNPQVHAAPSAPPSPLPPRKTPTKLIRERSGSASTVPPNSLASQLSHALISPRGNGLLSPAEPMYSSSSPTPSASPSPSDVGMEWFGFPCCFEIVEEILEVEGYQLYAVEKWIVQRSRAVKALIVYTGDPSHKITVTALSPCLTLSPFESKSEYDRVLRVFRQDGARPKDTPYGTVLSTSLARFPSDFTIVPIPCGGFLRWRDRLYTNINLLRMGCGGRSALTLEDPSETTKDRFVSMYNLPDQTTTVNQLSVSPTSSHRSRRSKGHVHSQSHTHIPRSQMPMGTHVMQSRTHSYSSSVSATRIGDGFTSRTSQLPPKINTAVPQPRWQGHTQTRSKDCTLFNTAVLELVKLIQASLAVFGMFPLTVPSEKSGIDLDGLLCDLTVDGIKKWIADVGETYVGFEPLEGAADPAVVAALLSSVLASRNKLAALGFSHVIPKDPFLHPQLFCAALSHYLQQSSPSTTASQPSSTPFHTPHPPMNTAFNSPYLSSYQNSPSSTNNNTPVYLTRALVESIDASYEKLQRNDSRKVHRVLLNKLDDLKTDLRSTVARPTSPNDDVDLGSVRSSPSKRGVGRSADNRLDSDLGGHSGNQLLNGIGNLASGLGSGLGFSGGGGGGAGAVLDATADLGALLKVILGRDKDRDGAGVGGSVRALWCGQLDNLTRLREREREKEKDSVAPTNGRKGSKVDIDKLGQRLGGVVSDGEDGGQWDRGDGTEDDDLVKPWSGRMQRKIGSWAGLSRSKKQSVELPPVKSGRQLTGAPANGSLAFMGRSTQMSKDIGDDDDILSSGQVSPNSDVVTPHAFNTLYNGPLADSSALNLDSDYTLNKSTAAMSDYDKRVTAFNQKRPWGKGVNQSRVSSWSDPVSARGLVDEDESEAEGGGRQSRKRRKSRLREVTGGDGKVKRVAIGEDEDQGDVRSEEVAMDEMSIHSGDERPRRRSSQHRYPRRRSFHYMSSFEDIRILPIERMRIDVEISGQLLIMRRREQHLANVLTCLQVLTNNLSLTNATLREDYNSHQAALAEVEVRTKVLTEIEEARIKAESTKQETRALTYESEQFNVHALWHMASPPRQKVLTLREKVFGTGGRRLPAGVHGAHGKFNRLQWTLDGKERLVDWKGRTESEAEEEMGVEHLDGAREEEEEDVVEHPGIKPMWLLRLFNSWGARWGASAKEEEKPKELTQDGTVEQLPVEGPDSLALPVRANGMSSKVS